MADVHDAPALQRLAGSVQGPPRHALTQLLLLLCEQLGLDLAFVATVDPGKTRTVRVAVTASGGEVPGAEGLTQALEETWCGETVARGMLVVPDVALEPRLQALPLSAQHGIVSHAGVVVVHEGQVIGTLCAVGHGPQEFRDRDSAVLRALAAVAAPWLVQLDTAPPVIALPAPRVAADLAGIADALGRARDLEGLSRPLLDALHELTGLGSTYLTVVHEDRGTQEIRYSRNTRPGFTLPEGLEVPWDDTLCKRALVEGRPCTTDVPAMWPDSEAAAALNIQVYVSVPVALSDGSLYGTLCAADSVAADRVDEHLPTMRLFSRLIASEVERGRAVAEAIDRADRAVQLAETDALTGCASRRVVQPWLESTLSTLPADHVVVVAFVDVDDFKDVNDQRGHAVGDAVLVEVAQRLKVASRPGDLVARMGGDEFVVAARVPRDAAAAVGARLRSTAAFVLLFDDGPLTVCTSVGIADSDACDVGCLLDAADMAMYAEKRAAREARSLR